jgi:hypothetical protein
MINSTIQITQEQFLKMHNIVVIPNLIALYIIAIFTFLIVGLNLVKHSRQKFFQIWIYSAVISGLFLGFLIIFPNTTQTVTSYVIGLVK